ncbi:MAG TPA: hypothetical protein VGI10_22730 [Polyangiaceae bacterium]|jgi:hypothetical protein
MANELSYLNPAFPMPVAADVVINADAMVGTDGTGHAVAASDPRCSSIRGRAEHAVDNAGGVRGALTLLVRGGSYFQDQDGTITRENEGERCYVMGDNTVSLSDAGGTRPYAGVIIPAQLRLTATSKVIVFFGRWAVSVPTPAKGRS